ncbi:MAG: sugar phosphate isomerase/epimerase [Clostridia bacterium]|nr:sugar phosphate isomerase/epimerase [Clostridia bacterium]
MYKLELSSSVGVPTTIPQGLKDGRFRYKFNPKYEEQLIALKKAGINNIEFGFGGSLYADDVVKNFKQALKLVKKHKLNITSVHFPFNAMWIDLATEYQADRKEIVKWIANFFKYFDKYDIKAYVFHPGGNSISENEWEKSMEYLCSAAEDLAKLTKVPICIENMVLGRMTNTIDKIVAFAEKAPNAYVVLDTNHYLTERPEDAILRLGNRIKALHISDNNFVVEQHKMPGDGLNDWNKIIGALETIGYDGMFNYEVNMNHKGYTCEGIVENYNKLFDEYNKSEQQ